MAEQVRLEAALEELNQSLGGVTPYRLALVSPGEVAHVEKNAHYMPTKVYRRLVENVRHDGNLSSLPFCWKDSEGKLVALSGNHRVDAARDASIERILVLYTDATLSRGEQIAVQLSHNAIVGADNKQILRELWDEILELEFKQYTGLDESLLETVDASSLERLRAQELPMEVVQLLFLPDEVAKLQAVVEALGNGYSNGSKGGTGSGSGAGQGKGGMRYAAPLADFDRFFEALLKCKEAEGIVNSATAILRMVEIVEEYLEKSAAENAG
jgi:hypothetical protein